ncbi:phosphoribosylanthranilate isomerase [Lyngbya confervoides]|uniref:N-(5'-phosphoribosyl)anthranilate isomerase n=1 Tax=Lyngbya confervoides BDU141951 TaxID=1574623 RepID=A0ABD4T4K5_9CYAN|nr:phosphoribosylanthranilate isomerase [Lyngbya confervoides]MCM1983408.1 phosphoribosylanthranilate isomerase [Lyngbya confervoides BDU141951]
MPGSFASSPLVKICGITRADQAQQIVTLGADALGFICVPTSARYLDPDQIRCILETLPRFSRAKQPLLSVGVFADASLETIAQTLALSQLNSVQLHGNEDLDYCLTLKQSHPHLTLIKAFRVKDQKTLYQAQRYGSAVDFFLFDAFHAQALGGSGQTWDWTWLDPVPMARPWWLAGGLTPENLQKALVNCAPAGIDLSSGVEVEPGIKDLEKVTQLFRLLALPDPTSHPV